MKKYILSSAAGIIISFGFTSSAWAFLPTFDFVQAGNSIAQIFQMIDQVRQSIEQFEELQKQGEQMAETLKSLGDIGKDKDLKVVDYLNDVKESLSGISDGMDNVTDSIKRYDDDLRAYDEKFEFDKGLEDRKKLVQWNEEMKNEVKAGLALQTATVKASQKRAKSLKELAASIDDAENTLQAVQVSGKILASLAYQLENLTQIVTQSSKAMQKQQAQVLQQQSYWEKNRMKVGNFIGDQDAEPKE